MTLLAMPKVGDKVQDSNGLVWVITKRHPQSNILSYNHKISYSSRSGETVEEDDGFIARFKKDYGQGYEYNNMMTLVDPSTPHDGFEVDIKALQEEQALLDTWSIAAEETRAIRQASRPGNATTFGL